MPSRPLPPTSPLPARGLRTVLVVDDDADMRLYLTGCLRSIGGAALTVTEAADGRDALHLARALLPALIISDVVMPASTVMRSAAPSRPTRGRAASRSCSSAARRAHRRPAPMASCRSPSMRAPYVCTSSICSMAHPDPPLPPALLSLDAVPPCRPGTSQGARCILALKPNQDLHALPAHPSQNRGLHHLEVRLRRPQRRPLSRQLSERPRPPQRRRSQLPVPLVRGRRPRPRPGLRGLRQHPREDAGGRRGRPARRLLPGGGPPRRRVTGRTPSRAPPLTHSRLPPNP